MRLQHIASGFFIAGLLLAGSVAVSKAAAASTPASPPAGNETRGPESDFSFGRIDPQKRAAFIALLKEHREKTYPLREQMWTKAMTLRALQNNPKVDPQQITALVAEMSSLRSKLHAERLAFEARVEKELGIDLPPMPFHEGRGDGYGGGCSDAWGHGRGMRDGGFMGYGGMGPMGHR